MLTPPLKNKLIKALQDEGLPLNEIKLEYILYYPNSDNLQAFASFSFREFPYLQHLVILPKYRNNTRILYSFFKMIKKWVKDQGYNYFVIPIDRTQHRLAKFVSFYVRKVPYHTTNKAYNFSLGV